MLMLLTLLPNLCSGLHTLSSHVHGGKSNLPPLVRKGRQELVVGAGGVWLVMVLLCCMCGTGSDGWICPLICLANRHR